VLILRLGWLWQDQPGILAWRVKYRVNSQKCFCDSAWYSFATSCTKFYKMTKVVTSCIHSSNLIWWYLSQILGCVREAVEISGDRMSTLSVSVGTIELSQKAPVIIGNERAVLVQLWQLWITNQNREVLSWCTFKINQSLLLKCISVARMWPTQFLC